MKITKVEIMKFAADLWDFYPTGIRIYTDEGIYGDGEIALAYGGCQYAAYGILRDFCSLIIGMDPLDHEVIWDKLYKQTFWGQTSGVVVMGGISAIDLALWDIKGKYFQVPVYKLLGGKKRDKLRAYASQLQFMWGSPQYEFATQTEDFVRSAKCAVAQGYDAIKIDFFDRDKDGRPFDEVDRCGLLSPYYVHLIEERLAAVREAVGPNVDIIMENHSFTDSQAALQLVKMAEKYNLFAFEEPNTPTPKMTKFLAEHTRVPIAHGERIFSRWQYAPYFEDGSVQLIQPDLGTCGGMTEGKKICDMAYVYDVGVQCHICASGLSTSFALHLEAVIPNFVIHEHHAQALMPAVIKLAKYDYQPVNGYFTIPELPGMGNEWSEWALNHCEKITVS